MNLQSLRYFVVLAEELNYTAAADKCFVSRQAISQSVKALESEYDVTLVQNNRNRIFLTPAGQRLYQRARPILASLDILDDDLKAFAAIPSALKIGVLSSLAPVYAPVLYERILVLEKCFPDIRCTVMPMDSEQILQELQNGMLDGGILIDMGSVKGYERTVLQKDNVTILMSEEHPLSGEKKLMPASFNGQTLLVMGEPEVCFAPLVEKLRPYNVRFKIVYDFYEAYRMVHTCNFLALNRETTGPKRAQSFSSGINLPLYSFHEQLETVLLTRPDAGTNMVRVKEHLIRLRNA